MQDLRVLIIIITAGTILFLLLVIFVIVFLFIYQRRRFLHKEEKEQLNALFNQTLIQSQLEIQEQTVQHISRELHDNLGQVAALIKANLNTIRLDTVSPESSKKIENTKDLVRQLITDLKQLSVRLSNDRLVHSGLVAALEMEVERMHATGIYATSLKVDDEFPMIEQDKALILYRMVQEVLQNIMKHSHASQIDISLFMKDSSAVLQVEDNGIGFDTEKALQHEGRGLYNLQSRAKLLGANLDIRSDGRQGTTVSIILS